MDGFVVHSDHISLNEMLTVNSHAISWLIPFFLYRRSTTYRGSFGNTLLIANIRSDTYGRTIDADKEDCHFGNYIYGYWTPMQGVDKEGTFVRMDKRTNKPTPHVGRPPYEETDVLYYVNNDIVDFSRYWKIGGNVEKSIQNLSFVFDEKGHVSSLVVTALDESLVPNIYLVRYLGDGKIGAPEIVVRDATLFGVAKKSGVR